MRCRALVRHRAVGSGGERTPRVTFHALARPGGDAQIRVRAAGQPPSQASQPPVEAVRAALAGQRERAGESDRKRTTTTSRLVSQLCCLQQKCWTRSMVLTPCPYPLSTLAGALELGYLRVHLALRPLSFLITVPPSMFHAPSSLDFRLRPRSVWSVMKGDPSCHACHRGLRL